MGSVVDLFREAGYAPTAPGWPGDSETIEETRNQPERIAGKGIDDIVDHYAQVISGLQRSYRDRAVRACRVSR